MANPGPSQKRAPDQSQSSSVYIGELGARLYFRSDIRQGGIIVYDDGRPIEDFTKQDLFSLVASLRQREQAGQQAKEHLESLQRALNSSWMRAAALPAPTPASSHTTLPPASAPVQQHGAHPPTPHSSTSHNSTSHTFIPHNLPAQSGSMSREQPAIAHQAQAASYQNYQSRTTAQAQPQAQWASLQQSMQASTANYLSSNMSHAQYMAQLQQAAHSLGQRSSANAQPYSNAQQSTSTAGLGLRSVNHFQTGMQSSSHAPQNPRNDIQGAAGLNGGLAHQVQGRQSLSVAPSRVSFTVNVPSAPPHQLPPAGSNREAATQPAQLRRESATNTSLPPNQSSNYTHLPQHEATAPVNASSTTPASYVEVPLQGRDLSQGIASGGISSFTNRVSHGGRANKPSSQPSTSSNGTPAAPSTVYPPNVMTGAQWSFSHQMPPSVAQYRQGANLSRPAPMTIAPASNQSSLASSTAASTSETVSRGAPQVGATSNSDSHTSVHIPISSSVQGKTPLPSTSASTATSVRATPQSQGPVMPSAEGEEESSKEIVFVHRTDSPSIPPVGATSAPVEAGRQLADLPSSQGLSPRKSTLARDIMRALGPRVKKSKPEVNLGSPSTSTLPSMPLSPPVTQLPANRDEQPQQSTQSVALPEPPALGEASVSPPSLHENVSDPSPPPLEHILPSALTADGVVEDSSLPSVADVPPVNTAQDISMDGISDHVGDVVVMQVEQEELELSAQNSSTRQPEATIGHSNLIDLAADTPAYRSSLASPIISPPSELLPDDGAKDLKSWMSDLSSGLSALLHRPRTPTPPLEARISVVDEEEPEGGEEQGLQTTEPLQHDVQSESADVPIVAADDDVEMEEDLPLEEGGIEVDPPTRNLSTPPPVDTPILSRDLHTKPRRKRLYVQMPGRPAWVDAYLRGKHRPHKRDPFAEVYKNAVKVLRICPCQWEGCDVVLNSIIKLFLHLTRHFEEDPSLDVVTCRWEHCNTSLERSQMLKHVQSHAPKKVLCTHAGCDIVLSNSALLPHMQTHDPAGPLKPFSSPTLPKLGPPLRPLPENLPTYQFDTRQVQVPRLSDRWHGKLGPYVLMRIYGDVDAQEIHEHAREERRAGKTLPLPPPKRRWSFSYGIDNVRTAPRFISNMDNNEEVTALFGNDYYRLQWGDEDELEFGSKGAETTPTVESPKPGLASGSDSTVMATDDAEVSKAPLEPHLESRVSSEDVQDVEMAVVEALL